MQSVKHLGEGDARRRHRTRSLRDLGFSFYQIASILINLKVLIKQINADFRNKAIVVLQIRFVSEEIRISLTCIIIIIFID